MCGIRDETIAHVVVECSQLVQNESMKIRYKIAAIIYRDMCKKFDLNRTGKS